MVTKFKLCCCCLHFFSLLQGCDVNSSFIQAVGKTTLLYVDTVFVILLLIFTGKSKLFRQLNLPFGLDFDVSLIVNKIQMKMGLFFPNIVSN